MSNVSTRGSSRPNRQWRRPEIEEHIKPHSTPAAALFGAAAAIAFGLVATFTFVMAAWLIASHGNESVSQVASASGIAWLALHLVPITIGTQVIGLLPWGFIVLPIYLLWRCTHWSLKSADPQSVREYWLVAVWLSGGYAVLNALVAAISSSAGLSANLISAAVSGFLLALAVSIACVLTYAPSRSVLLEPLPASVRAGIKPGFTSFMFLFVAGAALCSASMVLHFGELSAVTNIMAPNSYDAFFLLLLGIGYMPTATVWSMSYAAGPGVMLGGTSVVSIYHVHMGTLPAFPLLSVLPNSVPNWAKFLILLPVGAGILLYFMLPREHWQAQSDSFGENLRSILRPTELISLASALAVAGGCVLAATLASSGSLGSQLLKFVGPQPLAVTSAVTVIFGATVCLLLLVPRFMLVIAHSWQHRSAPTEPGGN